MNYSAVALSYVKTRPGGQATSNVLTSKSNKIIDPSQVALPTIENKGSVVSPFQSVERRTSLVDIFNSLFSVKDIKTKPNYQNMVQGDVNISSVDKSIIRKSECIALINKDGVTSNEKVPYLSKFYGKPFG